MSDDLAEGLKSLIGHPVAVVQFALEQRGWRFRIYEDDKDDLTINDCALSQDRVSVKVQRGLITEAWIG